MDAIVNGANAALQAGQGLDGAIRSAAGPQMSKYLAANYPNGCPTGNAVLSPGFNLPAKYVVHAVGPNCQTTKDLKPAAILLGKAYAAILNEAGTLGLTSIAIPPISTGIFNFPRASAATIAAKAIRSFFEKNPQSQVRYS